MTTRDKAAILAVITTRDEKGRHFTERFSSAELAELENEGLILIDRPRHDTGIPYACEYWRVEVTDAGAEAIVSAYY